MFFLEYEVGGVKLSPLPAEKTTLKPPSFGPNLVFLTLDIVQNSDGGISDFQISSQSLIKENCHNSRTSDDTDMKLAPITKEKKNSIKKIRR